MTHLFLSLWEQSRKLATLSTEVVLALYIDKNQQELALCILGAGTRDSCMVHPRSIFRIAALLNASGVILGHTHPSGTLEASAEDIRATETLQAAGKHLRIPLLGHIVITHDNWRLIC